MRKLLAIAVKDARVLVRDRTAMLILVAMPAVLILILGAAFGGLTGGGGPTGLKVLLVNEDSGHVGREIASDVAGDERLSKIFDIDGSREAVEARKAVERGDAAAAAIIPRDFTEKLGRGEPVAIELLEDPGHPIIASAWAAVFRSVATGVSGIAVVGRTVSSALMTSALGPPSPEQVGAAVQRALRRAQEPGALEAVLVSSEEVEQGRRQSMMDYFAGSMTAMFLLFGSMFGAFSFIAERRTWTLPRVLTTPTSKVALVGGKMLGLFMVGALQFAVLYLYTRFALHVWWGRSFAALALLAFAEVAVAVAMAILISSIAKSERAAGAIGPLLIQVFALLGGAYFPLQIFPAWLRPIHYLSPIGWAMSGIEALQRGGGLGSVSTEVAVLLGMAVLLFAAGVRRLRYE